MALRGLVFDTAARTAGVGGLTEALKWGQPSYLTEQTGSGTTVRIDRLKAAMAMPSSSIAGAAWSGSSASSIPMPSRYEGQRAMHFAVKVACRFASFATALRSP